MSGSILLECSPGLLSISVHILKHCFNIMFIHKLDEDGKTYCVGLIAKKDSLTAKTRFIRKSR